MQSGILDKLNSGGQKLAQLLGLSFIVPFLFSCASADYFVLKQHLEKKPNIIVIYQPFQGADDSLALRLEKRGEFSKVALDVADTIRKENNSKVSVAYCNQRKGEHCEYSAMAIENPELKLPSLPPQDGSIVLFYVYVRGDFTTRATQGFIPQCTLSMSVDISPSDVSSKKIGGVYSRTNLYSEPYTGQECFSNSAAMAKVISHLQLLPEASEKVSAATRKMLEETKAAQPK